MIKLTLEEPNESIYLMWNQIESIVADTRYNRTKITMNSGRIYYVKDKAEDIKTSYNDNLNRKN